MRRPLIIANWKSNPATLKEAIRLASETEKNLQGVRGVEMIIAPPFPFLAAVKGVLRRARLGAQNMFWSEKGPYTGEVSWRQLKSIGAKYVVIGHSERRMYCGESDEMVNKKVAAALENNLLPILCIGERERPGDAIPDVVGAQLKTAISGIRREFLKNLTIAYEPVWAISTQPGARPDTSENAFQALLYIRKIIALLYDRKTADVVRIIYGGSVRASNIEPFIAQGNMEGALVGGASLDPAEFGKIVKIAAEVLKPRSII